MIGRKSQDNKRVSSTLFKLREMKRKSMTFEKLSKEEMKKKWEEEKVLLMSQISKLKIRVQGKITIFSIFIS